MNAEEKRNLVKEKIISRRDKNKYDQSKREQVGYGFGDCSSTVQWAYKEAIGIDVGVNTVAQYCNVQGIDIDKNNGTYVDSEKGNPCPIEEKLKIADLLFFSGSSDSGRADYDYVAHVEMYIGDGTLIGHGGEPGSIGPKTKGLKEYCNQKVKVGQRYLKTRRFIKDDETDSKDSNSNSNTSSKTKAETNTSSVANKGTNNDTITNKSNQTYLKKNCKGDEVGILQKNLTALGYNTKGIDNIFGTNTEKAVIAFQKANGLEPDGIVGPKTQAKINLLIMKKVGKNLISYVIDGATLKCSVGTKTTNLLVPKSNLSSLQDKKQATVIDNSPNVNILPFGTCKKSNLPCSPKIKFNWINSKSNFVIGRSQVITKDSCLACLNGGVISIGNTGQSTVPKAKTSTTKSSVTSSQFLLKYGSKGTDVTELQTNLTALRFDTKGIDGVFGKNTKIAVIEFQKAYGLKVDGIVGPETKKKIAELLAKKTSTSNKNEEIEKKDTKENKSENNKGTGNVEKAGGSRTFTEFKNDFDSYIEEKAKELGVDASVLTAVIFVESTGSGFYQNNSLKIRFEDHIFYGKTYGAGNYSQYFIHNSSDYSKEMFKTSLDGEWKQTHAKKQYLSEYEVFEFAKTLDEEAAYNSISMGLGQTMGFNYKACGYNSAKGMYEDYNKGEIQQINGMINFFKSNTRMIKAINKGDYETFVSIYNGSAIGSDENKGYTKKMETYQGMY